LVFNSRFLDTILG